MVVVMDGWRRRGRMGTMKRGRFVKITCREQLVWERTTLEVDFVNAKWKRKLLLRDNR